MAEWAAEMKKMKEEAKRKRDAAAGADGDGERSKYIRRADLVRASSQSHPHCLCTSLQAPPLLCHLKRRVTVWHDGTIVHLANPQTPPRCAAPHMATYTCRC
jgi:hypothetical protein